MERLNKKTVPTLPLGAEMVACTYGFGRDSFLGMILAYVHHDQKAGETAGMDRFITWCWNAQSTFPAVAEGHYMLRLDQDEALWIRKAWEDFEERSRTFYRRVPEWFDHEAKKMAAQERPVSSTEGSTQNEGKN